MSSWFRVYGYADVHDELLVGAYPLDKSDIGMLDWMRVERVLNLVEDDEYEPGDRDTVQAALAETEIVEHRLPFTDYGRLPAARLERAVTLVVDWLDEGHRVYVHCRAGWQRSAAVAAGVVAIREAVTLDEALLRIGQRKPSADPLPEQREDLASWWAERMPTPRERLAALPADEGDDECDSECDEQSKGEDERLQGDAYRWLAERRSEG